MLKIKNKINLIGSVLDIGLSEDEYLFADHRYRIYKFSLKEFLFSFSKQVSKNARPLHQYSKAVSCSQDGYISMPKVKSSIATVYKMENNLISLVARLRWHRTDISVSKFSSDCKYLATGGEDGRVFIYTHPNHKLNTFLPRRPDYISCIAFGKHSENICYASYDLTLTFYNLKTDAKPKITKTPSVIEDMIFFDEDTRIFYVCKGGESGIFDLRTLQNQCRMNFTSWPTKIILNIDENYAYVGTREDVFYIHNLKDNTVTHTMKLSSKGVTCIKEYENLIFICFADGSIQIIDRFYKLDEFLKLLNQDDFEQAKIFAEQNNILLKTLEIYTHVKNNRWQEVIKDVTKLLLTNQIDDILNIATPYFEDPKKEAELKQYLYEKTFIQEFSAAFKNNDYAKAYEISSQHPCIKNLDEYKKMEEYFDKIYNVSQHLISQDATGNKEKVRSILAPFENIPDKKMIITTLLNNCDKYLLAEKYTKEQDFTNYFSLVVQCPFLKNSRTYKRMYLACEKMTHEVQDFMATKNYAQANEIINVLLYIEPFKEFGIKSQNYIHNIDRFLEKCKAKDYPECYKMLQLCPEMASSEEYIAIYDEIMQIFDKTKLIAQKGNTKEVYAKIQPFFSLDYWKNKVDIIMKIAYLYEIQIALESKKSNIDWKMSIEQYVLRYTKDDEIRSLCAQDEELQSILEKIPENIREQPNKSINHIQSIIFTKN
ncbi:WD40 repeat domain-containing protein [Helicobacter sp. 11S03491-1]|uniref:WD40 repeat domain-containing protein n=1 Tax=Helicobacter sp. 11S03491-1 TaxID=1476196 RepID=UPI000BA75017|nr:WD40 repeat domain-containing protein [Helicobacter sp. 11S03491-1]PAF42262.1 hypothetical protein BKH45_04780 [Helicobacter sp. 11S03491-1]